MRWTRRRSGRILTAIAASVLAAHSAARAQDRGRRSKPPRWEEKSRATQLVQRYAQAWNDDARRADILKEAAEIDEIPIAEAERFVSTVLNALKGAGPKLAGGTFAHPAYPGQVIVEGQGGGLALGLHGGGQGSGDGGNAARLFGGFGARVGLGVYPTVLQKRDQEWDSHPEEQRYCYELIRAAKRTFRIDPKRMYIIGFSMGGCGTWVIGSQLADHFTAVVTGGGGPCIARFENFLRTPVTIFHGDQDNRSPVEGNRQAAKSLESLKDRYGPFDFQYHEAPGVGHTWPSQIYEQQLDFALSRKKELFPKKVLWAPAVEWKRVFYWLKVDRPEIRASLHAEVKGRNEIHVDGSAPGLAVLLNDELVDLSEPVKVIHNGSEVYNGPAKGSLTALLLSLDDKLDAECALWAKIDLDSPR